MTQAPEMEKAVEAAACAMFAAKNGVPEANWEKFPERYKEGYRGMIRAALPHLLSYSGQSGEWQERARKIIADESRFAAFDPPGDVTRYALRVARIATAKQILGLLPMNAPFPAAPCPVQEKAR